MAGKISGRKILGGDDGQSLVEITLMAPLMLLLIFGVVEIGSIISTYMTLTHISREGSNLASRGTTPNTALDAVIAGASPTIRNDNLTQWRIVYSKIVQDPDVPCPPPQPCSYMIESQIIRGDRAQASKIGLVNSTVTIPGVENIGPSQIFHAFEVFYDYGPNVMTFVGNSINHNFYDRTIFTDTSGTP